MPLQVQDKLGPYLLIERLHQGELRDHWLALKENSAEERAAFLVLAYRQPPHSLAFLEELKKDFARRIRTKHPRLPAAIELSATPNVAPYLVLRYAPGVTLSTLLSSPNAASKKIPLNARLLAAERIAHICADVLSTVPGPHEIGLDHFKLGLDSRLKLLPRDRAHRTLEGLRSDLSRKKLRYLTPESVSGEQSSDNSQLVFTLGCVTYELLTGTFPFEKRNTLETLDALREASYPPVSELSAYVPRALDRLLSACLSKDPSARLSSPGELASALRSLLEAIGPCSEETFLKYAKASALDAWRKEEERLESLKNLTPQAHTKQVRTRRQRPAQSAALDDELPTIVELRPKHPVAEAAHTERETIEIGGVELDRFLVSNEAYQTFLERTGHAPPAHWPNGQAPKNALRAPVVGINREEAHLFAHHNQKRLLREAEWARAAGGPKPKRWPWGDQFDEHLTDPLWKLPLKERMPVTPVGGFAPRADSQSGLSDLCRVWEWTLTRHEMNGQPIVRGGPKRELLKPPELGNRLSTEDAALDIGFRCAKDLAPPIKRKTLPPKTESKTPHLGRYDLLHEVFQGTSRQLWLARAEDDPQLRVVERIQLRAEDHDRGERLLRLEYEVRSAIKNPRVPKVHGLLIDRRAAAMGVVVDYIRGVSLTRLMAATRRAGELIPEPFALLIAHRLSRTIHEAFGGTPRPSRLKPANVMLSWDGVVYFTGYRERLPLPPSAARGLRGKLSYMSPEEAQGHPRDARSALFSFGVILYELYLGQGPFARARFPNDEALVKALQKAEFKPLKRANKNVSPKVEAVVHRCLSLDPDERYGSMEALAAALKTLRGRLPAIGEPELGDYVRQTCRQQHLEEQAVLAAYTSP